MVKITKVGNRKIKLTTNKISELKKIKDLTRIYNPKLRFTPRGKNRDTDCKVSILKKNETWIGELDFIIDLIKKHKIKYKVYFKYENDIPKKTFLKYIKSIKTKFPPRDYQVKAIYDVLRYNFVTGESITGTGKSFIISVLTKIMVESNKKVLIVVTKVDLVEQMYNDMIDYFGNSFSKYMQKISGDYCDKMFRKNVIISTWQSLQNKANESFLLFDCVIADECDCMAEYNSIYRRILMDCENAKYVLGMTGTMPEKYVINYHNIVGVLGKHIVYKTEREAMKEGIVSTIHVITKKLYYDSDIFNDYIKHMEDNTIKIGDIVETRNKKWFDGFMKDETYDPEICDRSFRITDTKGMTKFYSDDILLDQKWFKTKTTFQKEIEFIANIKVRLDWLVELINSLDGNVLILTSFKDSESRVYLDYFQDKISKNIFYINSDVKTKDRTSMFRALEETDNNLAIALRATMDRGTSINNLQYFINLSSIKNPSTVRQMMGRIIRKDGKKNVAYWIDIVDCIFNVDEKKFSNSMKHYIERKDTYKKRGFKVKEEKIKLLGE